MTTSRHQARWLVGIITPKTVLMLAYNDGERGKYRLHFPTGHIAVPNGDAPPDDMEYDVIFYTNRVRTL